MIIGVDFDNTLACYDQLFHQLAVEQGYVSHQTPVNKTAVRDAMRSQNMEQDWISLQGQAYGSRINQAPAFNNALAFFKQAHAANITLYIVSHKTKFPVSGDPTNLHVAAMRWLEQQGFLQNTGGPLPHQNVFFELTKQAKLARIAELQCDHFIDDLPEFLAEPTFPANTKKWLFDPTNINGTHHEQDSQNTPTMNISNPAHVGTVIQSWQAFTKALIRPRTAV